MCKINPITTPQYKFMSAHYQGNMIDYAYMEGLINSSTWQEWNEDKNK